MSDLSRQISVNLDLWDLFISNVSIGSYYLISIITLASFVFKNIYFSKMNKLGKRPHIPNVVTKSQGHRLPGSGEDF